MKTRNLVDMYKRFWETYCLHRDGGSRFLWNIVAYTSHTTLPCVPEDAILRGYGYENLKFYWNIVKQVYLTATEWGTNAKLFLDPIHTGHGAHPASYTMDTGSFPAVKRPGRGFDHPPHLAPRLKKEYSDTSTPSLGLRGLFYGELFLYLYRYSLTRRAMTLAAATDWKYVC